MQAEMTVEERTALTTNKCAGSIHLLQQVDAETFAPDRAAERESSWRDQGRWLSLGVVVGRKL